MTLRAIYFRKERLVINYEKETAADWNKNKKSMRVSITATDITQMHARTPTHTHLSPSQDLNAI